MSDQMTVFDGQLFKIPCTRHSYFMTSFLLSLWFCGYLDVVHLEFIQNVHFHRILMKLIGWYVLVTSICIIYVQGEIIPGL